MKLTLNIRRAVVSDAPGLSDLAMRSKAVWGYDDDFLATCVDELTVTADQIAEHDVWLAERDGSAAEPIGFYDLAMGVHGRGTAELRLLFVDPSAKGTGVGGALWRHMVGRAGALDVKSVFLDADPFALPFYEHQGCVVVGQSPSGSIPGRFLPRLEKQLPGRTKP